MIIIYSINIKKNNILNISIGKGDRVVCYHCGGGLKDWGEGDIPWVEHAIYYEKCEYLLLAKGIHFINEVQRVSNQHKKVRKIFLMKRYPLLLYIKYFGYSFVNLILKIIIFYGT
jgi:hypothetical protein